MKTPLRQDIHNSEIPVLCESCEARHRGVCGALTSGQLVAMAKVSTKYKAPQGQELIGDATSVERYSNILSGVVKLTKTMADGRQQIVGLQFAPDFLGRPFQAESEVTAEAATDVMLCSFPRTAIERMMQEQPDLQQRLLRQTLNELDQAREWMLTLGRKTAAEKVASFLLMIAKHSDPTNTDRQTAAFELPLSRMEIADFLGLTIETISRQLTRLRTSGVLHIENNRSVTVSDMGRLEELASN